MRKIYHILVADGFPFVRPKDYDLKDINRENTVGSINQKHVTTERTKVPGNFTQIIDHSTNRPIILECKECEDVPLKNVVYYTNNPLSDSFIKNVMRIPCFYIGMDIDTGETWCMNYEGTWYKEYVMTYSDEKYAISYISVYDNKPSIVEYHMPRYINEAVVKGSNDSVYNIFVKYIGKDINTGKLMACNYHNHWFEVISTNPEKPIKYNLDFDNNEKKEVKNETKNKDNKVTDSLMTATFKYDGNTITVKYAYFKENISVDIYGFEVKDNALQQKILSVKPSKIGVEVNSGNKQLWAFYDGVWYKVCEKHIETLINIAKGIVMDYMCNNADSKKSHKDMGTNIFPSMYTGEKITVKPFTNLSFEKDLYVYTPKKDKVYFKCRSSIIWKELNGTEWVRNGGLWYLVCRDQKLIDEFEKTEKKWNNYMDNTLQQKILSESYKCDNYIDGSNDHSKVNKSDKEKSQNPDLGEIRIFTNPYNGILTKVYCNKYRSDKPIKVYSLVATSLTMESNDILTVIPELIGNEENGAEWVFSNNVWYLVYNKKVSKADKNKKLNLECSYKPFSPLSKKYTFGVTTIYANMAKWIYYQDPINAYSDFSLHANHIPDILHEFYLRLRSNACKLESYPNDNTFYYYEFTKDELKSYLEYLVFKHPITKKLFAQLKLSYNEMRKGLNLDEPNRTEWPKWEDDFVDLDALINNVVRDCIRDSEDAE